MRGADIAAIASLTFGCAGVTLAIVALSIWGPERGSGLGIVMLIGQLPIMVTALINHIKTIHIAEEVRQADTKIDNVQYGTRKIAEKVDTALEAISGSTQSDVMSLEASVTRLETSLAEKRRKLEEKRAREQGGSLQ